MTVTLTERQLDLLSMLSEGGKIVHSNDGDRAWLSGYSNDPWGDLSWHDMRVLRGAGFIGDEDDGEEEGRFHPAEVITAAGREALVSQKAFP